MSSNLIKSTTYNDIIINIRQTLIDNLNIEGTRVINAISARGPDRQKRLNNGEFGPYSLNDTYIIFQMNESNNSDSYIVMHEKDNTVSSIAKFEFHLAIYGNFCHDIAQKTLVLFKNQDILLDLREKGIYINGVDHPTSNYEIINNTVIPRCDTDIKLQVRFSFKNFTEEEYFSEDLKSLNSINIIKY